MASLTTKETEFLLRLAETGVSVFTFEQAKELWTPPERTPDALHRLTQKGWVRRLERGLYLLIPLEAGPARTWTESSWIIAPYLAQPAAIAYWSALHYWNMTEQIPQVTFVQTTRRKQPTVIAGMKFQFVTVIEAHFFGVTTVNAAGKMIRVTDREKTLIDCAARPDLSGGMIQLAQSLHNSQDQINWQKLDSYLERWGGGAVVKRLGYLVDSLKIPHQAERMAYWHSLMKSGVSPLEPGAGNHGPVCSKWQVRVNVPAMRSEELA